MKRILPFFFLVLFSGSIFGQCPTTIDGLTYFLFQEEVDTFSQQYPNCIEIDNSLAVVPGEAPHIFVVPTITNLRGLNQITSIVDGGVTISGASHMKTVEGLEGLKKISHGLEISSNDSLKEFHPNAFLSLKDIGFSLGISLNAQLEKIAGFNNLEHIGSQLRISENPILSSIEGISEIGLRGLQKLKIENNPQLSICHHKSICEYLAIGRDASIFGNAPGCQSIDEVLNQCDIQIAKIRFGTFYDLNQDGIHQSDEPFYTDAKVQVEPIIHDIPATQDSLGTYFVSPGNYSVELFPLDNWDLTTPGSTTIMLDTINTCDTILFGIFPNKNISKLNPGFFPARFRCGTTIATDLILKNTGTRIVSGILWFELDSLAGFGFVDEPDTIVNQYLVGWKFQDLVPSNKFEKIINLSIPIPPDVQLGDHLKYRSYAKFSDGTEELMSPEFRYSAEVRCSFDPNDKQVMPARTGNYTLFEEDLTYTVRFQNTGNDYAYDVIIRDTLDENIDPTSLKILSSSHYELLNTTIENDRFISFEFKNIFLPDSTTNFDGSQGYVSYLIRAKDGLAENTPINNTASIYFDFNPPIVTNTTESIMVNELPTSSLKNIDNQLFIFVFPNPTTGDIFIKSDNLKNAKITLTDLAGRILNKEKLNERQEISLPKAAKGMFFLKVETEEGIAIKRVIKI